ncbi:DUF3459 domain-containing protein, partial [Saccharothrix sp. MB29]|nr:DUF3459 domain-containing protein [Saccharothrix sp. MB29]
LSVAAQTGDPNSVLELYRSALAARRAHPDLGAGSEVVWLDAPADVLSFRRNGFTCVVNTGAGTVRLPADGEVLLSSAGGATEGADLLVPPDTTVWLTRP